MDETELWVPLVEPRIEDEEDFLPWGDTTSHVPVENGLAGASDSLALASPSAENSSEDVPLRRLMFSPTQVPDFSRIPRDRWEAVMRATPERLRLPAAQGIAVEDPVALVELALSDLPPAPSDLARAEVRNKPQLAPTPAADHFRRANRQVNFRLTESEYLDLATAAQLIGTTPTQLAGMLVRNGVRRVIEEANRPDG